MKNKTPLYKALSGALSALVNPDIPMPVDSKTITVKLDSDQVQAMIELLDWAIEGAGIIGAPKIRSIDAALAAGINAATGGDV
jgi:hypothetical protein